MPLLGYWLEMILPSSLANKTLPCVLQFQSSERNLVIRTAAIRDG